MASTTPPKARARQAWIAGLGLMLAIGVALGFLTLGQRLLAVRKPVVIVSVASGDPIVRRGSAVTLSATVELHDPGPVSLTLKALDARLQSLPMTGDNKGAFHITLPGVTQDFDYRIEAGNTTSEWHRVKVLTPVDVAPGSVVQVLPPAYIGASEPPTESTWGEPIEGLAQSKVVVKFRFELPHLSQSETNVTDVFVDFIPEGPDVLATRWPIEFQPRGLGGQLTFMLTRSGTLRLTSIVEEKGRKLTCISETSVHAWADFPPRFELIRGLPRRGGKVRPGARFSVEATATDDLGLHGLWLDAQFGASAAPEEFPGESHEGTTRASISRVLQVPPALREGDVVKLRLRAIDSRHLPQSHLARQQTTYPPEGWATFVVSASAPTLESQEIEDQTVTLAEAMRTAADAIEYTLVDARIVSTEAGGAQSLSLDQVVRLQNSEERITAAGRSLQQAAATAMLTRDLRPLGSQIITAADSSLATLREKLHRATTEGQATRPELLAAIVREAESLEKRLLCFREANQRLAFHRQDRATLQSIADAQRQLAFECTRAGTDWQSVQTQQQALLAGVRAMVQRSDPLREAMEHLVVAEARRLRQEIESLLASHLELLAAITTTQAEALQAIRSPLVQHQKDLGDRLGALTPRLESASRLTGVSFPRPEELRALGEKLARGETLEVLIEQEKFIRSLEHFTQSVETAATERQDPKNAARELSRWQAVIQARLREATRETPITLLPGGVREAFAVEQRALKRAVERLDLPREAKLLETRTATAALLGRAIPLLARNAGDADAVLREGVNALIALAEATPDRKDRLMQSRSAFDRLRAEQEAIATQSEMALRGVNRPPLVPAILAKLHGLHEQQQRLVEQVHDLDLPGLQWRQARLQDTMKESSEDLRQALPFDILASQADIRRQMERLRQAIEGQKPVDTLLDEAAHRQAALATQIATHPGEADTVLREQWRATSETISQMLSGMAFPEAGHRLSEAREALRQVETGFRDGQASQVLAPRVKSASDALNRLAMVVRGQIPSLERIRTLSQVRRRDPSAISTGSKGPPSLAESELRSRLQREAEELLALRVGPAQALKGRILDLYSKARTGGVSSQVLADALDELAAAVAETPAPPPRQLIEIRSEDAEEFLPSKALAASLRELTQEQRRLKDLATRMEAVVSQNLRPGNIEGLAETIRAQRFLAGDAAAADSSRRPAGEQARRAADRLRLGLIAEAEEAMENALRYWSENPTTTATVGLIARQDAIRKSLKAMPHRVATGVAQQKLEMEERLLTMGDLRLALLRGAQLHSPNREGTSSPFREAAAEIQLAETWMKATIADLKRGDLKLREKSIAKVAPALQKASQLLQDSVHNSHLESLIMIEAARRLREAEQGMQVVIDDAGGDRQQNQRSLDAILLRLDQASQAIERAMRSLTP